MLNISKDEKRYSEIELDLNKKLAYEKGRASIIEELEKIKEEIKFKCRLTCTLEEALQIIDSHIAELKGENE